MKVEQFFQQSLGEWHSMRSGHSLAFKHFEEIRSKISIQPINITNPEVITILDLNKPIEGKRLDPFKISWVSESDWEQDKSSNLSKGSSILIPFLVSKDKGLILRSKGYAEAISAISSYSFIPDGTLNLQTKYESSFVEEKIWFTSNKVRCRASVIKSSKTLAILQTSFSSEVKI